MPPLRTARASGRETPGGGWRGPPRAARQHGPGAGGLRRGGSGSARLPRRIGEARTEASTVHKAADQAASGPASEVPSASPERLPPRARSSEQASSAFAAAVSTARLSAFSTLSQDAT